ncbi:hypothetical protein T4D_489 [Trichinella pseudospiralis]|uniref:Uncharacterized protein n=1 Tax=Trichinella pseudospiralis TaxID=6337 RepID=A0A0V1G5E1_TRIPS|nr:hypothetical protein T4D_489 [Trichinella pseudospiralis]
MRMTLESACNDGNSSSRKQIQARKFLELLLISFSLKQIALSNHKPRRHLSTRKELCGTLIGRVNHYRPQAEAPPIDKEGTLRNTDWLEADRTKRRKREFATGKGNRQLVC